MGRWDTRMKQLIGIKPQDFVSWLVPDAELVNELSEELHGRDLDTDKLYKIRLRGQLLLLHIEFQRRSERKMDKRVWEYNVLATLAYGLPVLSFVIYLRKDSKIAESPVIWAVPNGQEIHRFYFENIKLWEIDPNILRRKGLVGLFPLLPLTQAGIGPEVIEEAIARIQTEGGETTPDLLSLLYLLTELACENDDDIHWLDRRFAMLYDVLQESKAYQKIKQEGLEEGLLRGRKEGELQALHQTILTIVQTRFPKIVRLAKKQTAVVDDPAVLQELITSLITAQTVEEARQHLLALDEDE
jgi:predicted transposase YdaD